MKNQKQYMATFVNCELSNDRLVSFTINPDCLNVQSYLKENGIKSTQFIDNNPTNIYDLSDDILSLAGDIIIFYVNELNFYLSRVISFEIKKSDPDSKIVFFGSMLQENFEYVLKNTEVDLCILSNPEKNICELLKNGFEDNNISGIATRFSNDICNSEDLAHIACDINSPTIYPRRNIVGDGDLCLSKIEEDRYPSALLNGFIAFTTGLYPLDVLNNSVKHVEILKSTLSLEEMDILRSFISVNSAVITNIPENSKNVGVFYTTVNNDIRSLNEAFDENIANAYSNNFYLPHLYSIKDDGNQGKELIFDDFNTRSPVRLSYVPYANVDSKLSKEIIFLSIETSDDLERFIYDVDCFISNTTFRNKYEITHYIKDECRWLSSVCCSVCKLPRLRLKDGLVFTCGGCSESIGSIHDSYFKVYQQAYIMSEKTQVERNCSGCHIKNECSKCCFLPDFLQGDKLCDVMKKRPYINLYIATKSIFRMLMESPVFRSLELSDIRTSNKYVSHLIPNQTVGTEYTYLYPFIYLLHAKSKHYIFNAATRKVFGTTEAIAIIMEFLQRGVDTKNIKAFLSDKYSLEELGADRTFRGAIDLLIESGCLRKKVI
ncbi:hypothetical protein FACS1894127_1820 [Clostridia bacterium]|nr:hypothetical protein FACS1894127_1820 [Clostridia bacterium]